MTDHDRHSLDGLQWLAALVLLILIGAILADLVHIPMQQWPGYLWQLR